MIRDFSREELDTAASKDTELTLGLGTVLGLGAGLLLLCVVCFGIGYAVGHRSSASRDGAVVISGPKPAATPASGGAKPGAVRQTAPAPVAETVSSDSGDPASVTQGNAEPLVDASTKTNPQVRPALQSSAGVQQNAPLRVQPATSQVQGWMVQIAAVSRTEDADVLLGALKKRGYTVTARRELGDNLIHVQTGPFTSRNDANAMRQKLLNDGYNAMVQ